jgi:metal-dependent amidase/aminoacylase/carboxypeptidase family protein
LSIDPELRMQELQTKAVAMEKVASERFEVVTQIVA